MVKFDLLQEEMADTVRYPLHAHLAESTTCLSGLPKLIP